MPNENPTPHMMECEEVLDLLHMLVENELDDDESSAVLSHLASCKSCRAALSQHIKLSGMLASQMPWLGQVHFSPKRQSFH